MRALETAALKFRVVVNEEEELTNEVFIKVVQLYKKAYGYIPSEWKKELELRMAKHRFYNLLITDGYDHDEIKDYSLTQLRDECENAQLVLVGNKAA